MMEGVSETTHCSIRTLSLMGRPLYSEVHNVVLPSAPSTATITECTVVFNRAV